MDYMTHIIPIFSEPEEKTLDPVYSIALSSDSVPIVSVKQTKARSRGLEPGGSSSIRTLCSRKLDR